MKHDIEFRLKTDHIADLLRGKKLVYETTEFLVTLYPENYGFFISPEDMHRIRRAINLSAMSPNDADFLNDLINTATKPITPTY